MSLKQLNQKGLGTVEVLLVILIVAILGATGYYVYHANKNANSNYKAASQDASGTPKFAPKKTTTTAPSTTTSQ